MPPENDDLDFKAPAVEELADILPAYEILTFIAKGGMGAVYLARQKSLDREVAIKILPTKLAECDEFRAAFEQEAKSMAKFNHPNLIGIYDFGQKDGLLYLIMEMVHGKSLYYSAYGKMIDPGEASRIVVGICRGLESAHEHGILHRDIKPGNILLDPAADPKIGDFGLARATGDFESDTCFGTPGYTAPEVVHDPKAVCESTDIYSVGVILYELLAGRLPGESYTPVASLVQCNPGFDAIIKKAMHPSPTMRYRSAGEMADALEKLPAGTEVASRLMVPGQAVTAKVGVSAPASATPRPVATVASSGASSLVRNLVIILGLLVAISIAWGALKKARSGRAAEQELVDEQNAEKAERLEQKKERERVAREKSKPAEVTKTKPKPASPSTKPKQKETPAASLARLQGALKDGSRKEMPVGAVVANGIARLPVDKLMTWHQAQVYCENHGGHLPVFAQPAELLAFCDKMKSDQKIWVGAGTSGAGAWCWIDGSPWKNDIRSTSKSAYVSVDNTGVLTPIAGSEKRTFYIQWSMSGKNSGGLRSQMARANGSSGERQYPAGTVEYDGRRYLLIKRKINWVNALRLADSSKGSLAVPSTADESEWILMHLKARLRSGPCLLGGLRDAGGKWKWLGGEPWSFAAWEESNPDIPMTKAAVCAATHLGKWNDVQKVATVNAALIEWSDDAKKDPIASGNTPASSGVAEMRKKCAELIETHKNKHVQLCQKNISAYERALDSYSRTLTNEERLSKATVLESMTQNYLGHLIPGKMSRDNMTREMADILNDYLAKQQKLEYEYLTAMNTLRVQYCANLQKQTKGLEAKGLVSLKREIETEIKNTGADAKLFISHVTGIAHTESGAGGVAGNDAKGSWKRADWKISSNSIQKGKDAKFAIDGNVYTVWHTNFNVQGIGGKPPHTLDISFGGKLNFSGISLTTRKKGGNGIIKDYEIYIRNGGQEWQMIHKGKLPGGNGTRKVHFNKKIEASELRVKALSSHSNKHTSLAEFGLIQ